MIALNEIVHFHIQPDHPQAMFNGVPLKCIQIEDTPDGPIHHLKVVEEEEKKCSRQIDYGHSGLPLPPS